MSFSIFDKSALVEYLTKLPAETDRLELKMNNFSPDMVGKYMSGLGNAAMYENAEFGFMVWGISDDTREVEGTTVRIASKKVGNDEFMFWLNKSMRPQINISHEAFEIDGKHIEILCVEPSYREPIHFKNEALVRIGNALQPLSSNPERARVIWTNTSRFCFEDTKILRHAKEAELRENFDIAAISDGLTHKENKSNTQLDLLEDRDLILSDNQGGYDVTALLALASAKKLSTYPSLIRKGVRLTTYDGTSKLDAKKDVHGDRGYATTFEDALDYIMERIPQREELEGGIRNIIYEVPRISVREFFANAIIHQDLIAVGDGPLVEIFSDRIKITNPGEPLVDLERFIDAPSKSRNAKFGKLMRDFGLCEERGSGVDRAIRAIEEAVLPPPLFQSVEGSTVVTVFMSRQFAEMTPDERIRACYQHACLGFENNELMSNASLRERFGLPKKQYPQISNVIRDAIAAGKIKPRDEDQGNRQARYVPNYA